MYRVIHGDGILEEKYWDFPMEMKVKPKLINKTQSKLQKTKGN